MWSYEVVVDSLTNHHCAYRRCMHAKWMDFNPVSYMGIDHDVSVSDDIVFKFVSSGYFFIFVNLKFKGFKAMFVLYVRVYDLNGCLLRMGAERP